MRIAIVHNLPSGGAKRGLHGFVRELAGRGHEITEIRLSTADSAFLPLTPFVTEEQIIQFDPQNRFPWRVPMLGSYLDSLTAARTLYRLDRVYRQVALQIDEQGYDLVFVHDCVVSLKPAVLRYLTTPNAFFCHHASRGRDYVFQFGAADGQSDSALRPRKVLADFFLAWRMYWWHFSRLERRTILSARHVLVNSAFTGACLHRDYGIFSETVPYGIDADEFVPLGLPENDYVLSVGALNYQKGYRFLVRALGQIPESRRPHLVILANAGDTNEKRIVSSLAETMGVQLAVHSVKDHRRLLEFYSGAKVFVYSPILEAFGLAPLEAMACAKPVVAVCEGGVPESVVNGQTGFLVERDEGLFAEAVSGLLANPEMRVNMGQAGREEVLRNWSWQVAGDRLERVLQQVIVPDSNKKPSSSDTERS